MRIEGYIVLTVKITREDDGYVAVCEELGVSTCDDSLDRLLEELQVLTAQHLNALERNGVRDSFFKKHGIRLHKTASRIKSRPQPVSVHLGEIVTRHLEQIPVGAGV